MKETTRNEGRQFDRGNERRNNSDKSILENPTRRSESHDTRNNSQPGTVRRLPENKMTAKSGIHFNKDKENDDSNRRLEDALNHSDWFNNTPEVNRSIKLKNEQSRRNDITLSMKKKNKENKRTRKCECESNAKGAKKKDIQ